MEKIQVYHFWGIEAIGGGGGGGGSGKEITNLYGSDGGSGGGSLDNTMVGEGYISDLIDSKGNILIEEYRQGYKGNLGGGGYSGEGALNYENVLLNGFDKMPNIYEKMGELYESNLYFGLGGNVINRKSNGNSGSGGNGTLYNTIGNNGSSGIIIIKYFENTDKELFIPITNTINYDISNLIFKEFNNVLIYKYNEDNDNGVGQTEYELIINKNTQIDILLLGGGGGGGKGLMNYKIEEINESRSNINNIYSNYISNNIYDGSGGDPGELKYINNIELIPGKYKIKVGNGGGGVSNDFGIGEKGKDSYFSYLNTIAMGGNGGKYSNLNDNYEYEVLSMERIYPTRRIVNNDNLIINNNSYGVGEYEFEYSSKYIDINLPINIFNDILNGDNGAQWKHNTYNITDGIYINNSNPIESFDGIYNGEWIKIKLPYKILLTRYILESRLNAESRSPGDFKIYGSNDNTNWIELVHRNNIEYTSNLYEDTIENNNILYQYYVLVVNKLLLVNELSYVLSFDNWYIYVKKIYQFI